MGDVECIGIIFVVFVFDFVEDWIVVCWVVDEV